MIYSYFEIGIKPVGVGCLTNAIAPPLIALFKTVQWLKRISQSSCLHYKKNVLVGGCGFFVSDIISELLFGLFWLMFVSCCLAYGPTARPKYFVEVFIGN